MALVPDSETKREAAVRRVGERLTRRALPLVAIFIALAVLVLSRQVTGLAGLGLALVTLLALGLFGDRDDQDVENARAAEFARLREADKAAAEEDAGRRLAAMSLAVWKMATDAMPDPMMVIDRGGRLIQANAGLIDLFPKAATGTPLSTVIRNPDLLDAVEEVRRSGGRVSVAIEDRVPVRRKLIAAVASLGAEGDPSGAAVAVVLRDVSEEERLAQMRADFIANASHELRTPLASLRGFVETLQGPARDDEAARTRFLGIMASQAERMTRLIDDLLSLSRIEMRAHVPPRGTVDLAEIATFVAQALEPVARSLGVKLTAMPSSAPAVVRGDRDELVQVVQNLVHNALKYGRAEGQVVVRVGDDPVSDRSHPRVQLSVSDDGPGIAPEHLPRLTERFYRINATVSREKGGTGLGLAIVKNIINRHRGELRITSEVGRGSTFTIVLDRIV